MPHINSYSTADDETLVRAVLGKDPEAFRFIIRRYERLVMHMAFRMIKNAADRDDICQEVFIRVHDKLHTFRFEAKLSTWIGRIAYHACLAYLQKKRLVLWNDWSQPGKDDDNTTGDWHDMLMSEDQNPGEQLEQQEQQRILQGCIEELSVVQRTILLLFHHDEMSLEEIVVIVDLPLNTIKSHLFRARKMLRTMMLKELTR
jgi:RNA polymerase sigma factor (sigma-70 family)